MIVSLTFDDGLDEHLDRAAPLLEQHGCRGTFYLPMNAPSAGRRAQDWRALAERGHELGNHTLFHPATRRKQWVTPGQAIEGYTLDRMRIELEMANRFLEWLDGKRERTFAYPCSNSVLGAPGHPKRWLRRLGLDRTRWMGWLQRHPWSDFGSSERDYSVLLPELFTAARIGGSPENDVPFPPSRFKVPGWSGDGLGAVALVETVRAARGRPWVVLVFHGIDSGHSLKVGIEALTCLVQFLTRQEHITVLPMVEAARRVWISA